MAIVALLCFGWGITAAATPEDYKKRVESVRFTTERLISRLDAP